MKLAGILALLLGLLAGTLLIAHYGVAAVGEALLTIGWTGFDGGKLASLVDVAVVASSDSMTHIEDVHLAMGHLVSNLIRRHIEAMAEVPS